MNINYTDDIYLMRLIRNGDQQAFQYLFDTWFVPLCRFMHVYIKNTADSEQLVLDIFTNIWIHRSNLEIRITFKAYLFSAARHKCLNYLRDYKESLPIDSLSISAPEKDVFDELSHLVEEAVCFLPPQCANIYTMSRNEGLPNKIIAEKLGISEKTVEAHITKALKSIKKYLGDNYSFLW